MISNEQNCCKPASSDAARFASCSSVSVTGHAGVVPLWMCVAQPRTPAVGLPLVGSQDPEGAFVETTLITPLTFTKEVREFDNRLRLTDSAIRPSAVTGQLQHSCSSWLSSKT